jgi:RNA-binding protein 25
VRHVVTAPRAELISFSARWRSQRQQQRTREYQDDVRDRQFEEDEQRALEKESEEFLKKQMAELAELEDADQARHGAGH